MFLPFPPRGRTEGCTRTSGVDAGGFAVPVAVTVAVATAVDVVVAVAVAVAVVVAVAVAAVPVAVSVAVVVGSGFGSGLFFCVEHATSIAGESIAALITERTTSLIGERPWYPMASILPHQPTSESRRFGTPPSDFFCQSTNGSTSA